MHAASIPIGAIILYDIITERKASVAGWLHFRIIGNKGGAFVKPAETTLAVAKIEIMPTANKKRRSRSQNGDTHREMSGDNVVDWLEQHIHEQNISIGDPLPTEEEIVRETQLSRTSVREGLTRLRALGVIDTKRKRGMRLTRSVALLDLVRLLGSTELPDDLKEHVKGFRSALELGIGPEIYRRCRPADIQELRQIYEEMVKNAGDPEVWPQLDCRFHLRLVSISGNQLAQWFHQLLDPFFRAYAPPRYPVSTEILERHHHIIDALTKKDPYLFDHAMREHHLQKLTAEKPERNS
jgi:GntR family transcriptional regulator, transcriptional repressor for pyruvate dehydrogenase complex